MLELLKNWNLIDYPLFFNYELRHDTFNLGIHPQAVSLLEFFNQWYLIKLYFLYILGNWHILGIPKFLMHRLNKLQ